MPTSDRELTDAQAKGLQAILGPHTFRLIVQQPTWNGMPLLNPAQVPLANNRPAPPIAGQTAPTPSKLAPPEKHYVQTRQPGAPQASAAPVQSLAPINEVLRQARDNMRQVAEAQARLAASGIVSLDTLDQQAKALDFLTGRQKLSEEQTKRLSQDTLKVRDAFAGVQKSMVITTATLGGTFSALKHMAGEAQPGLWRAMDGEMKVLTAELGSALLPTMMSVTEGIMDLVDWFAGMDDATKSLVAAGVIAIPATMALGHAITALGPAASLAKVGVNGLIAALGPVGATVAAIGVMAGGVAASVAAANYFSTTGHGAPGAQERAGERVRESELSSALGGAEMPSGPEYVKRIMSQSREELEKMAQDLRQAAAANRSRTNIFGQHLEKWSEKASRQEELATALQRAGSHGVMPREEEEEETKGASLMRRARHYNTMITEAQREQKPQYSGLAEARKNLQLQILGKSPIEQQLLDIQRKNVPKMVAQLGRIMQELREMNQRDRANALQ